MSIGLIISCVFAVYSKDSDQGDASKYKLCILFLVHVNVFTYIPVVSNTVYSSSLGDKLMCQLWYGYVKGQKTVSLTPSHDKISIIFLLFWPWGQRSTLYRDHEQTQHMRQT